MKTDKPENPWKKRRAGPRELMPPSRALYAEFGDGSKATAAWGDYGNHWKCISASGFLKWMRGMVISGQPQADAIKDKLYRDGLQPGIHWRWIEPNTVRVIAPPF